MANGSESKKDIWDKLDIIAKGVLALVVSGGIAFYTTVVQEENRKVENTRQLESRQFQFEQQQKDRRAETMIRLFNQREESDSNLRSKMFDTLLNNFFTKDTESKIVALQMIGLNFRTTLQIKPMFNQLDRELNKRLWNESDNEETLRLKDLLHRSARTIIRDQLAQIENAAGGSVCRLTLDMIDDEGPGSALCLQNRAFELMSTGDGVVTIQAFEEDLDAPLDDGDPYSGWKANQNNFAITYYDMPMVDFTRLTDVQPPVYYSLVLLKMDTGRAELAVAVLPTADYSSRNAYKFDELVSDIFSEDVNPEAASGN